jgi:hypothetical protein
MDMIEWVAWFNQERVLEPPGSVTPAESVAQDYNAQRTHTSMGVLT